jgi:hypothetical protein
MGRRKAAHFTMPQGAFEDHRRRGKMMSAMAGVSRTRLSTSNPRENAMLGLRKTRAATVVALSVATIGVAKADVIDGNWCNGEGRHFTIKGPTIVTTEGTKTEGSYSRHAFTYTIPTPDPSAGAQVFMVLVNEMTVKLRVGADPGAPTETWKRCDITS